MIHIITAGSTTTNCGILLANVVYDGIPVSCIDCRKQVAMGYKVENIKPNKSKGRGKNKNGDGLGGGLHVRDKRSKS